MKIVVCDDSTEDLAEIGELLAKYKEIGRAACREGVSSPV